LEAGLWETKPLVGSEKMRFVMACWEETLREGSGTDVKMRERL